jgi:hypothetical protein
LAEQDDSAAAALRLEAALERIARLAHRPDAEAPTADVYLIAARLDALIAQLRAALGGAAGS